MLSTNCLRGRVQGGGRPPPHGLCRARWRISAACLRRRVPELIPVLGCQPAGGVSHKPGGRLPLLSVRPARPSLTPTNYVPPPNLEILKKYPVQVCLVHSATLTRSFTSSAAYKISHFGHIIRSQSRPVVFIATQNTSIKCLLGKTYSNSSTDRLNGADCALVRCASVLGVV